MAPKTNPLQLQSVSGDYRFASMSLKLLGQPVYTYLPLFIYMFRMLSPTLLLTAITLTIVAMVMNRFGYNVRFTWYALRNRLSNKQTRLRRYLGYRALRF